MTPVLALFRIPFHRKGPLLLLAVLIITWALLSRRSFHPPGLKPQIDEIYGLIHLVDSGEAKHHVLYHEIFDATLPIDFSIYADGNNITWENEVERLNAVHPLVVFSELYCLYSRRAKTVLLEYDITPGPFIIELDAREDGDIIKTILTRLTGRSTLPNIFVRGISIGGYEELFELYKAEMLEIVLRDAGAAVVKRQMT